MTTKTERARGITLTRLDFSRLEEVARRQCNKHRQIDAQPLYTEMHVTPREWAMATVPGAGDVYVLNSEGVGPDKPVTEQHKLVVALHGSTKTENGESFSMFPDMEATMSLAELTPFMTEETVDLADFIRSFGGRLESNFWLWHRTLTHG